MSASKREEMPRPRPPRDLTWQTGLPPPQATCSTSSAARKPSWRSASGFGTLAYCISKVRGRLRLGGAHGNSYHVLLQCYWFAPMCVNSSPHGSCVLFPKRCLIGRAWPWFSSEALLVCLRALPRCCLIGRCSSEALLLCSFRGLVCSSEALLFPS